LWEWPVPARTNPFARSIRKTTTTSGSLFMIPALIAAVCSRRRISRLCKTQSRFNRKMVNKTAMARIRRDSAPGPGERIRVCSRRNKFHSPIRNNQISNKLAQLAPCRGGPLCPPECIFTVARRTGRPPLPGHCKTKRPSLYESLFLCLLIILKLHVE
jgi:hypothetical protein